MVVGNKFKFAVGLLFLGFFLACKSNSKTAVTYESFVDTITLPTGTLKNRGEIEILDNNYLNLSNTKLVLNESGFTGFINNEPLIKFHGYRNYHTLDDVPFPYTLYKRSFSDTIIIRKDVYVMHFLILEDKRTR